MVELVHMRVLNVVLNKMSRTVQRLQVWSQIQRHDCREANKMGMLTARNVLSNDTVKGYCEMSENNGSV